LLHSIYFENVWNNASIWRYISIFSILLLIFYKKKIRFFDSKEEKIEQDKNIFINSDLIMTENFLKEFLVELSINESYHRSRYEKVKDYLNYFEQKNNLNNPQKNYIYIYIDAEINASTQKLLEGLNELLKFVDEHFSETNVSEISDVYRLYPDLKHDPEFNYLEFQKRLYKLCRQAENLYSDYRLHIRAKLSI